MVVAKKHTHTHTKHGYSKNLSDDNSDENQKIKAIIDQINTQQVNAGETNVYQVQ